MFATRVISIDLAPTESSSRIANFEKICLCFSSINLQILNIVDFLCGSCLVAFAVYLIRSVENKLLIDINWLFFGSVIVGSLLLLVSVLSFSSITSNSCR
jgi:ABC-type uncharacterized transport system permease subunit